MSSSCPISRLSIPVRPPFSHLPLCVQYHDVGATIAGEILDFLTSKNLQLSHQVRTGHGHMARVKEVNQARQPYLCIMTWIRAYTRRATTCRTCT